MHNKSVLSVGVLLSIFWGLSSSSFFMFWCALELNTLWFLGILWVEKEGVNLMKYFLIQGLGSLMLVWGVFGSMSGLMVVSGLMKLGLFPFHAWSLEITEDIGWSSWFMLMSLQKLLPIFLLMSISGLGMGLMLVALLNLVVGCFGSFQKSGLKVLLFYSSLFNGGLLLLLLDCESVVFLLFILYVSVLVPCWALLSSSGASSVQQLGLDFNVLLMYLSLGGFPPTLGFLYKWSVFNYLLVSGYSFLLLVFCILLSLYMFYIYLTVIMSSYLQSATVSSGSEVGGAVGSMVQVVAPCFVMMLM